MVGRVEDFVTKKERGRESGELPPDTLSDFDKTMIGTYVRLEIPYVGRYELRAIAGMLRRYADQLEFFTRQHEMPDRSLLMHMKFEAKLLNRQIKELCEVSGKSRSNRTKRDEQ